MTEFTPLDELASDRPELPWIYNEQYLSIEKRKQLT